MPSARRCCSTQLVMVFVVMAMILFVFVVLVVFVRVIPFATILVVFVTIVMVVTGTVCNERERGRTNFCVRERI
jgi:hypothetical protein